MALPSRRQLAGVYLACGLAAGTISFALGQSRNLEVFRHAARALLAGRDLYDGSSVDWFKYSPTFALFFVPLAIAPAWLACALWGAINFGAAFTGIDATMRDRSPAALVAALPGILLATDGDQANLLVAGAMLVAFAAFERGSTLGGAAAVALGTLVKVFPLGAALFALLHRDRERSLFRVLVALGAGLAAPLAVVTPATLASAYVGWVALLRADGGNRGWSIVTVARDLGGSALGVQAIGCALLVVPVLGALVVPVDARFRRRFAAGMLVLVVLCNHRAEYTSFVLPAIGAAVWFADGPPTPLRLVLLVLAAVAPGPLFVRDDPAFGGVLAIFAAHRVFHPLRLVPSAIVCVLLQRSLYRALLEGAARRLEAA